MLSKFDVWNRISPSTRAIGIDVSSADWVAADETTLQDGGEKVKAIFVGGAGDLVVETAEGQSVTFVCVAGTMLDFRPAKILNSGTSATDIVVILNE